MKIAERIGAGFSFAWKHTRAWMVTSVSLIVFFTIVSLLVTQVPFLNNTMNTVFGEERRVLLSGDPEKAQYYTLSQGINSKEDSLRAANDLNEKLCEEGFVLLKNDGALPLSSSAKVSVFGMNSVNLIYGGSGSSAKSTAGVKDLYQSLADAGISYNPDLKAFYDGKKTAGKGRGSSPNMGDKPTGFATGELSLTEYEGGLNSYIGEYKDAALVVFSRIGGEGYDLPRTMQKADGSAVEGANPDDHYLELDNHEKELLSAVCDAFDTVIVVINCSTSMELGFLEDGSYGPSLKAALWIGSPGGSGMSALGRILSGAVNPSGHLVDTYARDFTAVPSSANFSTNLSELGNTYLVDGARQDAHFVDYEEGIYVGYRYYETRGFTDGEEWYRQQVVYPFGYGLSYSTFTWTLSSVKLGIDYASSAELPADAVLTAADKEKQLFVEVKVRNDEKSAFPGKDVVQLYFSAPYQAGEVEKSHVVLGDFVKTKLLQPGEEETVILSLKLSDTASYDFCDANRNGNATYEADQGAYVLYLGKNAHDAWTAGGFSYNYRLEEDLIFDRDPATGTEIRNLFDEVSAHIGSYLSRADWEGTFPAPPTEEDRNVPASLIESMSMEAYIGAGDALDEGKKWYSSIRPRQQRTELTYEETSLKLYDMIGVPYEEEETWNRLLSQLTIKQMTNLIGTGNFNTAEISNIGKPKTTDPDGPAGFTNFMTMIDATAVVYDTCFYAGECVIAATWNKDLAYEMGIAIGDESLIGNERDDKRTYSGWYAPAINIHRNPFAGRNWEYYSEDGCLSGKMAASVISGAKSKGVYTFVKHFAMNDQETDRDNNGLITWASEQAMREIYFKPFEYAVKEGKTTGIMSSFNRIGTVWAGGCYELLTELLREEWGFRGMVITDYATGSYMYADQMIRAGGDLVLLQDGRPSSSGAMVTNSHLQALRKATKNILYTVANSNAMNGMGKGIAYGYAMPYWKIVLLVFDILLVLACLIWGVLANRKALQKVRSLRASGKY